MMHIYYVNVLPACMYKCFSVVVWTHAVLGVTYVGHMFVFWDLYLLSTAEQVSQRKAL